MIVELEPWEWVHALNVAARRQEANWDSNDKSYYKRGRMEDDRSAQARACVCELAVAKATNRYWSGSVWTKNNHSKYKSAHADVGTNFEVRCIRTRNAAAVREHQVGKGLHLFVARTVDVEFKRVDILGHIKYDDAWELATTPDYIDPSKEKVGYRSREIDVKHLTKLDGYEDHRKV